MYKNELWVVVSADFDDISDRTFVISRRTFALLIESVHLHLLLCHNSHGHLILHVSPCVPWDPDRARQHATLTSRHSLEYIIPECLLNDGALVAFS